MVSPRRLIAIVSPSAATAMTENGGFDCSKTAVSQTYFVWAHSYPATKTTVFYDIVEQFLKLTPINYSHLKNLIETPMQMTARATITITGSKPLAVGRPSEAAFRSFIPCVSGRISATFWSAVGITS